MQQHFRGNFGVLYAGFVIGKLHYFYKFALAFCKIAGHGVHKNVVCKGFDAFPKCFKLLFAHFVIADVIGKRNGIRQIAACGSVRRNGFVRGNFVLRNFFSGGTASGRNVQPRKGEKQLRQRNNVLLRRDHLICKCRFRFYGR